MEKWREDIDERKSIKHHQTNISKKCYKKINNVALVTNYHHIIIVH